MHDAHEFLKSLTVVLGVAAITTVLFQRLRQPVVLGYIIAGLIVGPHVPIPLVADTEVVQTLSELGVILLMFSLGLEFSLRKLMRVAPTAGLTAVVQSSIMMWLGFVIGQLFGWSTLECLFAGGVIAISSTTIIAKAFDEQGVTGRLREVVVGILIVEDLIAVLLMTVLTAVASGSGLSARPLAMTIGRLAAFLVGLTAIGMLVVPRLVRAVSKLKRRETTLVTCIGICFGTALLAGAFGYSVALGAFIAGSLVAESGEEHHIIELVEPVRDMFGAIFFVSVGMLIDPALVVRYWPAVAVLTLAVVIGKVCGVTLGAFVSGSGLRTSVQAGMSLAQIGEFAFIIAALGVALQATGAFLYPVAVAVSAVTTLLTPWLIRASGPVASWVDRVLPAPLQTYAALYGSWVEDLRTAPRSNSSMAHARRLFRLLALDGAVVAGILVAASAGMGAVAAFVEAKTGVSERFAGPLVVLAAGALAAPFCIGVIRVSRRLGVTIAKVALPVRQGRRVDFAAAPRRALVVTLQLASVVVIGAPLIALTQPFLPGVPVAAVFVLMLALLGIRFWRTTTNLQGHVRAGAEVVLQAIAAQSREPVATEPASLDRIHQWLPGLGSLVAVHLDPNSPAVGKTLAELNLRGLTGATVLAITRGEGGVIIPSAKETLRAGDSLGLAGTHEAIEVAKNLLMLS